MVERAAPDSLCAKRAMTVSYAYDETGLRTKKASGPENIIVVTVMRRGIWYTRHGITGRIICTTITMQTGVSGPSAITERGMPSERTCRGDVIAILDTNGEVVARYTYDAWGKVLMVTDGNGNINTSSTFIGNVNPIRYRGYYYDTETGWYYLNSQYYDPQVEKVYQCG